MATGLRECAEAWDWLAIYYLSSYAHDKLPQSIRITVPPTERGTIPPFWVRSLTSGGRPSGDPVYGVSAQQHAWYRQ
jgi:hypothetical protein